jgi:hypothetical protein
LHKPDQAAGVDCGGAVPARDIGGQIVPDRGRSLRRQDHRRRRRRLDEGRVRHLGSPPFAERGAVTDEYIQAWKILWTEDRPSMHGKYVQFENVLFEPKPVSKPHPPIWVGGESPPSIRRAARLGDAWYPSLRSQKFPLDTPTLLKAGIERLHREAEKLGRDPASIDIAATVGSPTWLEQKEPGGQRRLFTGSTDAMLEDAAGFASVGVKHLIVSWQHPTIEQILDPLHRFGEEVVRKAS